MGKKSIKEEKSKLLTAEDAEVAEGREIKEWGKGQDAAPCVGFAR